MKSGANLDFELLMAHIFEGAGIGHTQIYKVWRGMIRRCHNKAYHRYHDYGGRGITVCDEWRYDFHSFLRWSMGDGGYFFEPMPNGRNRFTIERIENDDGYHPMNCRWATTEEQNTNKRDYKGGLLNGNALYALLGLHHSGLSTRDLGKLFGLSSQVVSILTRRHSFPRASENGQPKPYDARSILQDNALYFMIGLHHSGLPVKDVGKFFGADPRTISRLVWQHSFVHPRRPAVQSSSQSKD
jgi:hypothetical protein